MKFLKFFLIFLILSKAALAQDKPLIITSINPLYQILLSITKDQNNSILIINPNVSEHNYQLKKSDVEFFSKADLIFYIDDELEKNFPKLIKNFTAEKKSYKVSAINEIKLLQRKDNNKKLDVHLWMNPENSIKIAQFMTQKICEIDAKNCQNYRKNLAKFKKEISQLEEVINLQMAQIKGFNYIFYHDGYQYFENYFDLKPSKNMVSGDNEISVKNMRALDALVKSGEVKCIVGDVHDEKNSAQKLAKNYKLKFFAADLIGKKDESYESLLLNVVSNIAQCD
jgi:zinc transport system substrate-binding protein